MASHINAQRSNLSTPEMLGRFFYIVDPYKNMFEKPTDVPDYIGDAMPFFVAAVLLEMLVAYLKGEYNHKMFYVFNNVSGGIVQNVVNRAIINPLGFVAYCYIYNHYSVYELPWDSLWTWFAGFMGVDLAYYCFHRSTHEVNLLWAAHQMHHSSEDFNLTTATRQSLMQKYFKFFLPMAFFVPPSIYLVHFQFNLLYQFWIHTELVPKLGPLEYIFNTASHHRVHHGRNPYCIDKNYGGTLIIWDRLFGTFAEEKEKVSYGLVHTSETAVPMLLQTQHFYNIFQRAWRLEKWSDKFGAVFRGPGWMAECEKVGMTPEQLQLPEVEQPAQLREVEALKMEDRLETRYVLFHFLISCFIFWGFMIKQMSLTVPVLYGCLIFLFATLTSCGFILEGRWFWYHVEVVRCGCMLIIDGYLTLNNIDNPMLPEYVGYAVRFINVISLLVASFQILGSRDEQQPPTPEITKKRGKKTN